jgi:hypothetical protein
VAATSNIKIDLSGLQQLDKFLSLHKQAILDILQDKNAKIEYNCINIGGVPHCVTISNEKVVLSNAEDQHYYYVEFGRNLTDC